MRSLRLVLRRLLLVLEALRGLLALALFLEPNSSTFVTGLSRLSRSRSS